MPDSGIEARTYIGETGTRVDRFILSVPEPKALRRRNSSKHKMPTNGPNAIAQSKRRCQ